MIYENQLIDNHIDHPRPDLDRLKFHQPRVAHLACPSCTEADPGKIIILDDKSLRCDTCGHIWGEK